ncbi:MAG: DUF3568 family protein [Pseudomonadota bacterium]
MKTITRATATALLLVTLLCSAGCGAILLGGAAAAGTYVYLDGQARNTYSASLQQGYDASLAACRELTIPVTSKAKDGTSAKITGKLSGDTVIISMKLVGDNLTQITVRVGMFGDESTSRRIHATISRHL